MPPMSKVEVFAAIRRDSRAGMSVRALARKYEVSRRTVRSALTSAWPAPRKPMPPRPSKLDAFKPVIDDILRADLNAPRKQRHTIKRIYDRLIDEHGMREVSYPVVRRYVADRKPTIRAEAGHGPSDVFFPQTHRPGVEAEVDFGEVVINLRGEPVTCMLFAFRLSFSGKSVHRPLRLRRHRSLLGRPCPRIQRPRRCPYRQDPIRQPAGRRRSGPRLLPRPGRDRPVDRVPLALNPCCREFPKLNVHLDRPAGQADLREGLDS